MVLPKEGRAPKTSEEIRELRMDEMEEVLLQGRSTTRAVRECMGRWGLSQRPVELVVEAVRARWKVRADERNTPESRAQKHEECVSMVRQIMAQALEDGKHQVALVATQQLATLEGLNSTQTMNVVHSGKVTVSDERLPFELLRAFGEVLRIADAETRRVLCSDLRRLTAENEPEQERTIEAEGLRVVR